MSFHVQFRIQFPWDLCIVYAKGCPVEGTTLILVNEDGSKIELIKDSKLRYDLLK